MAAPVISLTSSALSFGVGQDFVFQPTATGSPTSWSLDPSTILPTGVFFSPQTGTFAGNGQLSGVYNIKLYASNGDGTSDPAIFVIGFFNVPLSEYSKTSVINTKSLNVICYDGVASGSASASAPITYAKLGDDLMWNVKFTETEGTSASSFIYPRISMIKFAIRKDDASPVIIQSDELAYKSGMVLNGGLYYPEHFVHLRLSGDDLIGAVLENLQPASTYADMVGEFQVDFISPINSAGPKSIRVSTKTFLMRIAQDIADSDV